jgi:preprotein translocase subunit SecB
MAEEQTSPQAKQVLLQKIYIKDLSFESPKAPGVFRTNVASPQTQLNIRSSTQDLGANNQEVTLTLTVEAKDQDQTLFLVEIAQSGVFFIQGYTPEERSMLTGSFCPNTLYAFAREAIADIVGKGGFPQLLLQPINFDALYAQAVRERAEQQRNDGKAAQPPAGGEAH